MTIVRKLMGAIARAVAWLRATPNGERAKLAADRDITPCPECGSILGIYSILSLPSLWNVATSRLVKSRRGDDQDLSVHTMTDIIARAQRTPLNREEFNAIELVPLPPSRSEKGTERRERRNWTVRAGDFGPCKYCFNGLIYDDSSGSLKLRRVSRDEIMNSKISGPGRLSIRPDDPAAHVAKDWEATITAFGLDMTEGTPEKNQQKLTMEALAEASRLVSKDALTEFIFATLSLSFERWRDLYLGLFSNGSDEDKRRLILSLKTKAEAITSQMMDKVVEIRDEVIPRWSAMQAQVGLEISKAAKFDS